MNSGFLSDGNTRDISGAWTLRLDSDNTGLREQWFRDYPAVRLNGILPGSTDSNGVGEIVEQACLAHLTRRRMFTGSTWWQRDVVIPDNWKDQNIELFLERTHWVTEVWVDVNRAGSRDSLCVPHRYDLSPWLTPGRHRLTIRVDNNFLYGVGKTRLPEQHASSVSDHNQTNWNGIIGKIALIRRPRVRIERLQAYPQADGRRVRLVATILCDEGEFRIIQFSGIQATITFAIEPGTVTGRIESTLNGPVQQIEIILDLGPQARTWDEFDPHLYTAAAELITASGRDHSTVRFGMRQVAATGTGLSINGRPLFLRGTLECAIFPSTGFPPCNVPAWQRIYRICREHGLNHLRFHSWCPPEAAFIAADEAGFYLQIEGPIWSTFGQDDGLDRFIFAESRRICDVYGDHPSFVLIAHGNEPTGHRCTALLQQWIETIRAHDPRHLCAPGTGWPTLACADVQLRSWHQGLEPVNERMLRLHKWAHQLEGFANKARTGTRHDFQAVIKRGQVAVVTHEIGQWCAYPDYSEIPRYNGVLRAANLEFHQANALAKGFSKTDCADFLSASGRLQLLCYKEEIETQLRTGIHGGFQLLDLHDNPGQGTALVGVLTAHWETKGYHTPEEYRAFAGPTVPLARFDKDCWTTAEQASIDVEVAHFGPAPLTGASIAWRLEDHTGVAIQQGRLGPQDLALGAGQSFGRITVDWSGVRAPARTTLVLELIDTGGQRHGTNRWDLWVYPPAEQNLAVPKTVTIARDAETALASLATGGRVLLAPGPDAFAHTVRGGFSPIFWNSWWARDQLPDTLGLLIDTAHPALADFPTRFHSDWQWREPCLAARPIILDDLGLPRPIVAVVDDWNRHHHLGLVFEARVGAGHLVVCAVDLDTDLAHRHSVRQLRHSLLAYLAGNPALPAAGLAPEQVRRLLKQVETTSVARRYQ